MRQEVNTALKSIASIPVSLYGFALQKSCTTLQNIYYYDAVSGYFSSTIDLIYAAISLLLVVMASKCKLKNLRRYLLVVGVSLAALSLIVVAVHIIGSNSVELLFVGKAAQAANTMLLAALWVDLYSSFNPIRAVFLNAASIAIAFALSETVEGIPAERVVIVSGFLTAITCIAYCYATRSKEAERRDEANGDSRLVPYKATMLIAMYSFAYGFATVTTHMEGLHVAKILPSLVVIAMVLLDKNRFSVTTLYRMAFPLMVGGFLMLSFALREPPFAPVASFPLDVGFATTEMLLMFVVFIVSYSTGTHPIWLFGVLCVAQFVSRFVGSLVGSFCIRFLGAWPYACLEIVIIIVAVTASVSFMSEKSLFTFWTAASDASSPSGRPNNSIRTRIDVVGASRSLTDREIEVFYLLAKGKTNSEIARDMFISDGTVKAHLHHIYQKTGVHSRKELLRLVEVGAFNDNMLEVSPSIEK